MTMCNPEMAVLRHTIIPTYCLKCGRSFQIKTFSDFEKESLVAMAQFQKCSREKEFLDRTAELFSKFPDSKHATIVCKTINRKEDRPRIEPDEIFDEALNQQPDLKRFLFRHSFILSQRKQFIRQMILRLRADLSDYSVHCLSCAGLLTLQSDFFDQLT